MLDSFAKVVIAVALAGAAAPSLVLADSGDDQYAVAAGHYARDRWQLAIEEFQAFRKQFPQHAKLNQSLFFEGEAHVQLGQFRQARDLFEQFVKRDPQSKYQRQALFRWGESCYLMEDFAAARPVLEQFKRTYAKDKLNAYVLAYLGQIAWHEKDAKTAKEYFEALLKDFPESQVQDECRFGLARIAEESGDADSAERIYLALSAKTASPWADDAQLRLGALQYAARDYEAALKSFEAFETTFKASELRDRALLSRGWALFHLDRLDEAASLFTGLQSSRNESLEARYWLGLTQKAQKRWSQAADTLVAASQIDPKSELTPAIVFHAGDALSQAGQREAATAQFDRLLSTWPKDAWADDALLGKLQLALAAADHPQVDRLASDFARQFPESPLSGDVRRVQAQSLLARKEFAKAAEVLKDAGPVKQAETLADQYLLAATEHGMGHDEQALAALEPVLKGANGQLLADARLLQASVLVSQEKYAKAIQALEAHLAADPQGPDSARCRAQLATCYARSEAPDKARRTYEEFIAQQPPQELRHSATQQLAEALFATGDYAWSAELFQSLASADEPAVVAARGLSGLAWSRYQAGELEQAAATFQQLLQRYPNDPLASDAALARAQILDRSKQPQEALAAYQLLIEKYSQSKQLPQAMLGAARLLDKLDQNEKAAALYARLIKEFPEHESLDAALYESAWVLRELNRWEESDQQFETIYKDHRDSRYWADATFRLAERAQSTKRFDDAQRLLADLTKASPEQKQLPHILYLQGQAAAGQERWADVIVAMRPLVEGDDSNFKPLAEYWTAEALYRQGDFAAAGQRLAELSTKLADSRELWTAMVALRRAQILAEQKKWKEAQDIAASIAQRWSDFDQQYEADYVVGRAMAARGELTDARAQYKKVVDSQTGGKTETAAMAQWMIGESFFHQKNYAEALRAYTKVEILYAYPTWQAASLLQAGKCSEHLGEWKQAGACYERVVKEFPESGFVDEAKMRLTAVRERLAGR